MAVTTTPQDIFESAYAKSTKNNPGAIATDATELLNLVNRIIRKMYVVAARVNPGYFGVITQVSAPGTGLPWARPEGAESVFRIETVGGAEVVVVPYDDRVAEENTPAVYRIGKNYYAAGNASDPDPSTDALNFWTSKRPTDAALTTSTIDSTWEEQFNELLILEVALYLAKKDGRGDEVALFEADRQEWMRMFVMFLEHETANERRRRGQARRIQSETLVPLAELMGVAP
ncbi:MAG: hypothetical protein JSW25_07845 [Thermoplasmata archaeon]|nr:MAG: hypothetical protein JSW25_07845 [Thermoplasmata archaeon]